MGELLVLAFKKHGFTLGAESTTQKLQAIADSLSVEPDWIAAHYEAFMSAREYTKEVQEEDMDAFGEYAKQENKKQSQAKLKPSSPLSTPRPKPTGSRVLGDFTNLQRTPYGGTSVATPDATPGWQQRTSTSSTADLSKLGVVTSSLNSHLSFADAASSEAMDGDSRPPAVTVLGQSADSSPLFMMDRLQDKVNFIEERMIRFAEAVEAIEGCSLDNPLGLASQVAQWHVGRICCDGEGRLNASSALLEGSIRFSQGQRVRLNLSKLASYRIFPGQIVAVEGVNPSGMELVASRLVASALPSVLQPVAAVGSQPTAETAAGAVLLSVVVASGPFTMSEDLDYEPLEALLHFCLQHKPDLLLLLGPFVDGEQPCIQGGAVQQTFQDIFEEKVIFPLQAAEGVRRVALVPSTRDAHHLPVFPQPPLCAEGGGEKMVLLDNPSTFCCRGVTFGVVTADVLRHLSSQEIQYGNPGGDRLAAIASHLIWQQSYYPMFPPAVGSMLDTTLADRLQLPATPDVLLLPSDLNSFAKLLPTADNDSTVCVNPGRLTKGSSRGGFAHIRVADRATAAPQNDAADCFGNVCRVDITHI